MKSAEVGAPESFQFPEAADGAATAEMRRRLEHAAAVTARLSHDFGNFLTGILGFTELSMLQLQPDSTAHGYLQEVMQSAQLGADWIRRLHLFCGRTPIANLPTHFSSVVAEEEAYLRAAGATRMRWEAAVPADLPLVALDAASLQTLLREIVANAREAVNDQGLIRVQTRVVELSDNDCADMLGAATPGKFVEISVTDDGPGIAPDKRPALFRDIFFSTKPKHRGIGLLVVYGILQRGRGSLRITSGPNERGTTVHLYLPAVTLMQTDRPRADSPQVLLAHQDSHLLETIQRILESRGCRVRIALTPQDALSAYTARGQAFALVIAGAQNPQFSGLELARRLLEREPKANFLFLMTHSSFHGLAEEELLKRFPLYAWPMELNAFVKAIDLALTHRSSLD